jgi:hypothetical protein
MASFAGLRDKQLLPAALFEPYANLYEKSMKTERPRLKGSLLRFGWITIIDRRPWDAYGKRVDRA